MKPKKHDIKLEFKKEQITNYSEPFENTINNIYVAAILIHQVYGRLGYQIKLQEQILEELKKLNKDK